MPYRLNISLKTAPAMTVNRVAIGDLKLVYVACANKLVKYPDGRSPVVYIGTTQNGISRLAASAAYRSEHILNTHGVTSFDVRIVTCRVRQNVRTWVKLEEAFLIAFREKYGSVPLCNTKGKRMEEGIHFQLFARKRVDAILDSLAATGISKGHQITD